MGLFNWYIVKRNSILQNIQHKRNYLSSEWEGFQKRETYLTSILREKLLEDYTQLFHWIFLISRNVRTSSKEYNLFLSKFREDIENYNEKFINSRLSEYKTFFDGKQHNLKQLDLLQRKAIIVDDNHNLVIAGAGAGKTAVLTSKIAYLVNRQDKPKIKPANILVLAFNNLAVDEIQKRMKDNFQIDGVNVTNFHKLGCHILHDETSTFPSLFEGAEDSKIRARLRLEFNELLKDKKYQELFLQYLSSHLEDDVTFEEELEYYEYMRNKKYTTLRNEEVNSVAERDIANFFFIHDIEYEYEKEVDWIKNNNQEYHPDFYLPKYDIYIEHWGLNRHNEVPAWFGGKNPSEEYLKNKKWKINQFEKYKKNLVETWDYERIDGKLILNLMERLKTNIKKIKFERLSFEKIVEKTYSYKENAQEIIEMIASFINISKANGIDGAEIKRRIKLNQYSERQKIFGKIAVEVFIAYEKLLQKSNKIDFNDMVIKATELIRKNSEHYKDKYDYILIDEFQDISKPRWDMIMALLECNSNTKLFCVGDDWQSINGFAGSEVDYFINFNKRLKYCQEIPLKTNYRSSKTIVDMSNSLISRNKNRTDKEVHHNKAKEVVGEKAVVYVLPSQSVGNLKYRIDKAIELIRHLLTKGVDVKDIIVLSRFNKILREMKVICQNSNPKIPVEEKKKDGTIVTRGLKAYSVHSSKGLEAKHVIMLDVISGTYGFPSEIKDSSVLEMARNNKKRDIFEEERRLFYVALTRSKEFVYMFTIKDRQSIFLKEIKDYIEEIRIN
ncbi:hypothetical protein COU60_04525 [Candidatus Pacearchaeota archaeon CG10_big_fil_rev_8_21_14_0_10_34_76]|nr:MAG: hypothetical protein COU60_04525 [Candidatus Pacearchaeota archaeon CG10_big_fil_rev_8_21_14_0_10_34_76]